MADDRDPDDLPRDDDVAVVGLACRFPGAHGPDEFWTNLVHGVESVRTFTPDELRAAGVPASQIADPRYVPASAPLDDHDRFDAGFFGFSPLDASIMDPQHRVFLEVAWEALEHSGHVPEHFDGAIGVYAGCGPNTYWAQHLLTNADLVERVGPFLLRHTGNDKDFLSTRVAYCFDLRGPAVSVQTACSTSLVAVHLAVQSLQLGESDLVLAGGVTIDLPQGVGYRYEEGEVLSPDGHCRAFDAQGQGTVFGSGAGVVALRRYADAVRDGDTVYAVLKGSAVNNDGARKVGYLAPSVDGQVACVTEALAVAGVDASTIAYVEAHGTGTNVGDPIEVTALTDALGPEAGPPGSIRIGSTKPNIGHLDTAAGVASLVKVVLALRNGQLPASLNFSEPNPLVDWDTTPLVVNAALTPFVAREGAPRRAAVNSLGVGGTNAFVIAEEAPPVDDRDAVDLQGRPWALPLSARTPEALDRATRALGAWLAEHPDADLGDVVHTLRHGRRGFKHRRVVAADDHPALVDACNDMSPVGHVDGLAVDGTPWVAFLLPGGGAQFPGMARDLHATEPAFRDAIEACLAALGAEEATTLRRLLLEPGAGEAAEAAAEELTDPLWSVLSVFATEYALARLLATRGVEPTAMLGHSLGEWTAACLAGVIDLADVLRLVEVRGRIFRKMDAGRMVSVVADAADVEPLLGPGCSIAAVNGAGTCTVAGEVGAMDALEARLLADGVVCTRVPIAVAAHSPLLDPFLAEFEAAVRAVALREPQIPYLSCRTGTWVTADQATDPAAWVGQLRDTVRFADGVAALAERPGAVLVEVGPGTALSNLARGGLTPGRHAAVAVLDVHRGRRDGRIAFELGVGALWAAGVAVDWPQGRAEGARRIGLPTYPFERERHWIERTAVTAAPATSPRSDDPAHWASRPTFVERDLPPGTGDLPAGAWLVLDGHAPIGGAVARHLTRSGAAVVAVEPGDRFEPLGDDRYLVDPCSADDLAKLVGDVEARHGALAGVVHAWLPSGVGEPGPAADLGLVALVHLGQALATSGSDRLPIVVVTDGLTGAAGTPVVDPARATVIGPVRVLPRELPGLTARLVDLDPADVGPDGPAVEQLAGAVVREALTGTDAVVAWRNGRRHVEWHVPVELAPGEGGEAPTTDAPVPQPPFVAPGGTVVVTGGLGGVGRVLAGHLAAPGTHVVLVGRQGVPPAEEHDAWLADHLPTNATSSRIRAVRELEARGARVSVVAASVLDADALEAGLAEVLGDDEHLDAVLHAAGTLDDGPVLAKTVAGVRRVLDPKVAGTLALDAATRRWAPRHLVLFSSTSAHLGPAGQVDYTGANAFLEAYAASRADDPVTRVQAVAWGIWRGVGIAARGLEHGGEPVVHDAGAPTGHPLLARVVLDRPDRVVLAGRWEPGSTWVLDEHRLADGTAILPGAAYPELVLAAMAHATGATAAEVTDLRLERVLEVPDGERRDVRVDLRLGPDGADVLVGSLVGDEWVLHATARVRALTPAPLGTGPAPAPDATSRPARPTVQVDHLRLGRRWSVVRTAAEAPDGGVDVDLALDPDLADDTAGLSFHPGMVDALIGVGIGVAHGRDHAGLYAPVAFGSVRVVGPVPAVASASVHVSPDDAGPESITLHLVLRDGDGRVVAEARDVALLRTDPSTLGRDAERAPHRVLPGVDERVVPERLRRWEAAGIGAAEGGQALDLVVRSGETVLVVTPTPLESLAAELADDAGARRPAPGVAGVDGGGDGRAPRSEAEAFVAEQWTELLGVPGIGVDVDFFDAGGHSLLAARLVARLNKRFGSKLGIADILSAATIAGIAKLVDGDDGPSEFSPLVALKADGDQRPVFLIHGVGGNIGAYGRLAKLMPAGRPLYALQAKGVVEGDEPLRSIDEQVAYYLSHVRAVQPQGPLHLAGYSYGGVVAWEMARHLRDAGEGVASLTLLDTDLPGYQPSKAQLARLHLAHAAFLGPRDGARHLAAVAAEQVGVSPERFRGVNANPVGEDELMALSPWVREVREVNWQLFHRYRPQAYSGRVTLLRARPGRTGPRMWDRGWSTFASQLDVRQVEGQHMTMLEPPHVERLAQVLAEVLDEADAKIAQRT